MYNAEHTTLLSPIAKRGNSSSTTRLENRKNLNMSLSKQEYYNLINGFGWMPASFQDIANSVMENGVKQMYHALVNQDDIHLLFSIPNLKIFWCCRCDIVGEDGTTAHEHLHALVQYKKGTHLAFKKKMQRGKQRFHSKTSFLKIILEHNQIRYSTNHPAS